MQKLFREYVVQISHFQTRDKSQGKAELTQPVYAHVVEVRTEATFPNSFSSTNTETYTCVFVCVYLVTPYFLTTSLSNQIKWHICDYLKKKTCEHINLLICTLFSYTEKSNVGILSEQ